MSRLTILTATLIAALGATSVALAQNAPVTAHAQTTTAPAAPAAKSRVAADQPVIKPGDRNCLRHTGSLIPPKHGKCMPVVGSSYSGEELRRTGTQNNARALQMLDPSISVGH